MITYLVMYTIAGEWYDEVVDANNEDDAWFIVKFGLLEYTPEHLISFDGCLPADMKLW